MRLLRIKKDIAEKLKKAQVLVFVFFLLLITATLSVAIMDMWSSQLTTQSLDVNSLTTYYLAQAGIEYAKARAAVEEGYVGGITNVTFLTGGNFTPTVTTVTCGSLGYSSGYNNCRRITCTANYKNLQRRIMANVSLDSPGPDPAGFVSDEDQRSITEY